MSNSKAENIIVTAVVKLKARIRPDHVAILIPGDPPSFEHFSSRQKAAEWVANEYVGSDNVFGSMSVGFEAE